MTTGNEYRVKADLGGRVPVVVRVIARNREMALLRAGARLQELGMATEEARSAEVTLIRRGVVIDRGESP